MIDGTIFSDADLTGIPDIYDIADDDGRVLWVLYVAQHRLAKPLKLAATDISDILLTVYRLDVHINKVTAVLGRNRQLVYCDSRSGRSLYSLLKKGDEYVDQINTRKLLFVEPAKSYSSIQELHEVLGNLKGRLLVCDPYVNISTLDHLTACCSAKSIRLLTVQIYDEALFRVRLGPFSKEFVPIEVRRTNASQQLHDRYIITDGIMIHLGTSLNSFGKNRSIATVLGQDIRVAITNSFQGIWDSAETIQ